MSLQKRHSVCFWGASSCDGFLRPGVDVLTTCDGIEIVSPEKDRLVIPLSSKVVAGGKVTASAPLTAAELSPFVDLLRFGGGALNQAHFTTEALRSRGLAVHVHLVDSGAEHPGLREYCRKIGLPVRSLGCHEVPFNLLLPYHGDKLCIRSPLVHRECAAGASPIDPLIDPADVLCVISPKVASPTRAAVAGCRSGVVLQPNDALDVKDLLPLLARADLFACNFKELGQLAENFWAPWVVADETAPGAAVQAAATLSSMRARALLTCHFSAVTLGRQGNVVVDADAGVAWHNEIVVTGRPVATRSGAGDRWLAEWIICHKVLGQGEPDAARAATGAVARWLGLNDGAFQVVTQSYSLASLLSSGLPA